MNPMDTKDKQLSPMEGPALLITDSMDTKEEQVSPMEGPALLNHNTGTVGEEQIKLVEGSTLLTPDIDIQAANQDSKIEEEGCLPTGSDATRDLIRTILY